MTPFTLITISNNFLLGLTLVEKWQAIRRFGGNFTGEPVFVLVCITALLILTVTLIAVSYKQRQQNIRASNELFLTYADRRGLSRRERHILLDIASKANLKQNESIFTLPGAFNRGATKVTDEALASYRPGRSRRLGDELAVLREKLGFERRLNNSSGSAIKPKKPDSRQISVGKNIRIKLNDNRQAGDVKATVIKNDEIELTVKLNESLEAKQGDLCCVHYYFGSSIWEFDSSVLSCHGGILILTHSYDVRFINRRRFLRVPVNRPAFIASFPFARTFHLDDDNIELADHGSADESSVPWGPPEFVPGHVTELAGPGLRIEAPLKVEVGDRVVVILKVSAASNPKKHSDSSQSVLMTKSDPASSRVVEDVGEVRHVKATKDGYSIAVELTGLNDSNVNELVRETNSASLAGSAGKKEDLDAREYESSNIAEFVEKVDV